MTYGWLRFSVMLKIVTLTWSLGVLKGQNQIVGFQMAVTQPPLSLPYYSTRIQNREIHYQLHNEALHKVILRMEPVWRQRLASKPVL